MVETLESLLVSSEKAVVATEETLSQAKTVLEEAKLTLEILVTDNGLGQQKEDSKCSEANEAVERAADLDKIDVDVKSKDPSAETVVVDSEESVLLTSTGPSAVYSGDYL